MKISIKRYYYLLEFSIPISIIVALLCIVFISPIFFVVYIFWGVYIQKIIKNIRCPRCNTRLKRSIIKISIPDNCSKCGYDLTKIEEIPKE
ncbi:MAG: hypothetical protein GY756_27830 [bacterium]|nr:hypothetical protein [bacterium]